jgi:hypothetical protein
MTFARSPMSYFCKMRQIVLFCVLCVAGLTASAQYSSPTVLGTAGGSHTTATYELSWTMGEGVIMTLDSPSSRLTCGFHQSDQICNGDFDFDGVINTSDMLIFLTSFGCTGVCLGDFDMNNQINTADLLVFLSIFGNSCY